MAVKVLDAGGKLVLTCDLRLELEAALEEFMRQGARVVSPPGRLGSTWVAACTVPPSMSSEPNSTLTLAESETAGTSHEQPEFEDGCTIAELGFKRIITGPSKRAVELRIEHFKKYGADVLGEVEQQGSDWVAVVDTGGADKEYRW